MDDKYLSVLEYDKIIEQLAGHTSFSAGRELALALRPSADEGEVRVVSARPPRPRICSPDMWT